MKGDCFEQRAENIWFLSGHFKYYFVICYIFGCSCQDWPLGGVGRSCGIRGFLAEVGLRRGWIYRIQAKTLGVCFCLEIAIGRWRQMAGSQTDSSGAVTGKKLDIHSDEYLNKLMTTQFSLSFKLFLIFVVILLGLPVLNLMAPTLMNYRMFGFTVTWFFLSVLIYPVTWVISWIYVKRSIAMEEEAVTWADREEH